LTARGGLGARLRSGAQGRSSRRFEEAQPRTLAGAWEWYWRDFGAVPGYRDDDALWARQRRRIDELRRTLMATAKKKARPDRRSRSQGLRSEISRRTGAPRRVLRPAGLFLSLGGDVLERAVHDARGAGGRVLKKPQLGKAEGR
jgi:hypothetical protein